MEFAQAAERLHGIPHIPAHRARVLYDFLRETGVRDILELGFAHGASTCYMAAALDAGGAGHITTMDLAAARSDREPNLESLLRDLRLERYVEPVYCEVTYTWELMKLIERQTSDGACRPMFDFCFIDGAHTWETDGMAFFLVDKLLRPGGWVLFDDLHWRYAQDPVLMGDPRIGGLPPDMTATAQVGKVFGLLVCQHAGYGSVRVEEEWGWAQKLDGAGDRTAARVAGDVLGRVYGNTIGRDALQLSKRIAKTVLRRA